MSLEASDLRPLGRTSLRVSCLGFGGAPLGNLFSELAEADAAEAVAAAYGAGIRLFDTAPLYGHGLSEHRLGAALRRMPRDSYVLATKIGRLLRPQREADGGLYRNILPFTTVYDYSYDGVMRSVEDSLQRLGLARIDILHIHDVDIWTHGSAAAMAGRFAEVMRGGYRALLRLRDEKTVGAIGVGVNEWQACQRFAEAGDFDCFLLAGRYTLLEQEALESFLPLCERRRISVIIGGPFNTGILATGAVAGATYNYRPAPDAILDRVRRIEDVCRRHGVALASAALQFPLHHPAVASVIPGARSAAEVAANIASLEADIPAALWRDLKAAELLRPEAPTP
jgi:D-threo-aldose 1-dehydrogenase